MDLDLLITVALVAAAVVLFVTERVPFDVTALVVVATLMLSRVLTPRESLSGLGNEATVTIAAMFVLSEGIRRSGVLNEAAAQIARVSRGSYLLTVIAMMLGIAFLSAFVNNTAAVAIFIPITIQLARELGVAATRLLMPLSFAAMFGGVCTLIGTSTNLLVNSIAGNHGLAPFGMFEFAPLGLALLAVGFAYMLTAGTKLLPDRSDPDPSERFELDEYLTDVRLGDAAADVGASLREARVVRELDLHVVQVLRDGRPLRHANATLRAGDVLRVRGKLTAIQTLLERRNLELLTAREQPRTIQTEDDRIVEAIIAPDSRLVARHLREADLARRHGARVLGIRHHGRLASGQPGEIVLGGGDSLLLLVPADRLQNLEQDRAFVFLSEAEPSRRRPLRVAIALAILTAVVAAAAVELVPIVVSAVVGAVAMVLCRCLSVDEAYDSINWRVILLLAGVLPLGLAIEKTGLADVVGHGLLAGVGPWGPTAVLGALVAGAMLITNVMSNQATAVLLAPVALRVADSLQLDPRPLLIGVTIAASLSFMSPIGYQTNTMIYGAGNYRFRDFLRIGAPLNFLLWIAATLLIPKLWSF